MQVFKPFWFNQVGSTQTVDWTTAPSNCQVKRTSGLTLKRATRNDFPLSCVRWSGMRTAEDGTGYRTHVIHTPTDIIIRYLASIIHAVFVRQRVIRMLISLRSRLHLIVCQVIRRIGASRKDSFIINVPMDVLSREQWEAYHSATHYHDCEKPFAPDIIRIRDYCYLTDYYRAPTHFNCNLNYNHSFYIPIVFHNLSGYDLHFIIMEIAIAFEDKIDVLPITKEKYI